MATRWSVNQPEALAFRSLLRFFILAYPEFGPEMAKKQNVGKLTLFQSTDFNSILCIIQNDFE